MHSGIAKRIVAESGLPRLFSVLADELTPSDLQSLLLEVYQQRARTVTEPEALSRFERVPMLAASTVDARLLNEFDSVAFAAATDFEALELSPVGPFGLSLALGGIDQNNVLTTIRNADVLGDCTPVLALECARRRRKKTERGADRPVRLCSSHRVIRLQPFDFPGFTPHFRLFGMVSAGRDTGSSAFEMQHLREHIGFYLRLFRALNAAGFSLTRPLVEVSDLAATGEHLVKAGVSREEIHQAIRAHRVGGSDQFLAGRGITMPDDSPRFALVHEQVFAPLQQKHPEAEFRCTLSRLEGLGYYTGLCLRVSPAAPDGSRYPIADGGFTDWTARLLQDRKERLLTSGIGSEFTCRRYRAA